MVVFNPGPLDHLPCMFSLFPRFNTPDSNEWFSEFDKDPSIETRCVREGKHLEHAGQWVEDHWPPVSLLTRLLVLIVLVSTFFSAVILITDSWASFSLQGR